jgi:hypothetical protein
MRAIPLSCPRTDARAQAVPCAARGLDAFESAQRARCVVEDKGALHDAIRRNLDPLEELVHSHEYRLQFYFYIPIYFRLEDENVAR